MSFLDSLPLDLRKQLLHYFWFTDLQHICKVPQFSILNDDDKLWLNMFNSETTQSMYVNRITLGSVFVNAINDKLINDNYVERFVLFTHGNVVEVLLLKSSSLSQ